jgi:hypothetical protein
VEHGHDNAVGREDEDDEERETSWKRGRNRE